ncbi:hypothetical protein E2562_028313 [Oryza meyeriana var. granulata]|uniref:Uncharacterized protein n=1 Tax=Oryza meyeriana var. granulata TaxID=110450 RepID=A0A6G1FCQ2_9ORYZ|nr:hypothetical protein E2562_028313 [Oryza meyeriana var. granulata]
MPPRRAAAGPDVRDVDMSFGPAASAQDEVGSRRRATARVASTTRGRGGLVLGECLLLPRPLGFSP